MASAFMVISVSARYPDNRDAYSIYRILAVHMIKAHYLLKKNIYVNINIH